MCDRLDDWLWEHDRAVSIAQEVITVVAVIATVAGLLIAAWALTDWWPS